jgi:hypothetical protein
MTKMTQTETIQMFIEQLECEMEELSWEIREETNFEINSVDDLSDYYDQKKEHLDNLKSILSQLTLS